MPGATTLVSGCVSWSPTIAKLAQPMKVIFVAAAVLTIAAVAVVYSISEDSILLATSTPCASIPARYAQLDKQSDPLPSSGKLSALPSSAPVLPSPDLDQPAANSTARCCDCKKCGAPGASKNVTPPPCSAGNLTGGGAGQGTGVDAREVGQGQVEDPLMEAYMKELAAGRGLGNCWSKLEHMHYHRRSNATVSEALVRRLRAYEETHRSCVAKLSDSKSNFSTDFNQSSNGKPCRFLLWRAAVGPGVGNRIMTLVSAFVYALLTDRVLLIDSGAIMSQMFCEPFPYSSWKLSPDSQGFPRRAMALHVALERAFGPTAGRRRLKRIRPKAGYTYFSSSSGDGEGEERWRFFGSERETYWSWRRRYLRARRKENAESGSRGKSWPSVVSLRMSLGGDGRFFCDSVQDRLEASEWVTWQGTQYPVPGLYFVERFRKQLEELFPDRSVFRPCARYLLHPANDIWDRATRSFETYLRPSARRVGVQVRDFSNTASPKTSSNMLRCAVDNGLLPRVASPDDLTRSWSEKESPVRRKDWNSTSSGKVASVIVASLLSEHISFLREVYGTSPAEDGTLVSLHELSSLRHQQKGNLGHDKQAVQEIWLLSFTEDLMTSEDSTFGYAAHALAGLRPLILFAKHGARDQSGRPCVRGQSVEPCFHQPAAFTCPGKGETSLRKQQGGLFSYIKACQDRKTGIQLLSREN